MPSRTDLINPVQSLNTAFSTSALLSNFTSSITNPTIVIEHGPPELLPYFGRKSTGPDAIVTYFGLIAERGPRERGVGGREAVVGG
ncbi:hypothetical protein EYZ11_002046 [Aspergillus tanneri]|uniref:Uncharacterized protein n=1 Tax=Aspergillus tanneri TaxID=1220188 RepID=A0A4S3JU68_9EURO|nr:hypothetical protein EYZ11_002046 [Aspergillus tanneri]